MRIIKCMREGYTMFYTRVKKSYVGLLREEENGTRLFYPVSYSKPHFMNKSVYEIWNLIENRTEEDIVEVMKKKYPKVGEDRLRKDVKHTIAYFINLEMVKEVNECMEEKVCDIRMFEEKDFTNASKFIMSTGGVATDKNFLFTSNHLQGETFKNYYKAINMRTNHFHQIEVFLNVVDKETEENIGVIGIYVCPNNSVVYITTIVLSNKYNLESALNGLETMLRNQTVKEIKIKFADDSSVDEQLFCSLGFKKESVILFETINGGDFFIYGKEIERERVC
ncbi:MAG: PqqD family protein [Paenibacillaceae bacterium]|nr:PqqD family protein [Paenibacillaceae bacterium]